MKKFGYKTQMQVPRIEKITLNMGVGETVQDKKILDHALGDLTKIAGQKPVVTKARKSIATFKVRKDYPVGCMVTLRGARMYEFLDRLVSIAIPRIRDFRGISARAFDGPRATSPSDGCAREQIIFPEIEYDKIDAIRGMNISITTTAKSDGARRWRAAQVPVPGSLKDPARTAPQDSACIWPKLVTDQAHASREDKRRKTVARFAGKRAELIAAINDQSRSEEDRAQAAARRPQALPRNASPARLRNRCKLTGRPRGVVRKFGLGRNKLREIAMRGEVPGLTKASW